MDKSWWIKDAKKKDNGGYELWFCQTGQGCWWMVVSGILAEYVPYLLFWLP